MMLSDSIVVFGSSNTTIITITINTISITTITTIIDLMSSDIVRKA